MPDFGLSKAEGLPLALIESISLGNTFICSDIEPHREVYETLEEGGYLFDGSDDDLISKMNKQLIDTEKEKLPKNVSLVLKRIIPQN